jgi:hypothetical protein
MRHNLMKARQATMNVPGKLAPKSVRRESPAVARNESALLVSPLDPNHIVGVEEITLPDGTPVVSARISFDGGGMWRESWPLPKEPHWAGVVGPVVAVDARGTLNLAALALDPDRSRASLVIYRSEDGGIHWGPSAAVLHGATECCYSIATDLNPDSPFRGNVYLAADMGRALRVVRCIDGGHFRAATPISALCFNPEVLVDGTGAVHIVWTTGAPGCSILSSRSEDGGKTFGEPVVVAEGITSVHEGLPETAPAICIGRDGVAICAWADDREGRSRIYCRRSTDGARTWNGPASGEPLTLDGSTLDGAPLQHEFQPHLIATPAGEICCAFYEYGAKAPGGALLVDLAMAVSYDRGATFCERKVLSEQPWDPAVDKPISRTATRGALGWLALS